MEMAILWLCVVQFPYTMVPQIENKVPFGGVFRRFGRLLLLAVLLLAGYAGHSQTNPLPYTIQLTVIVDYSIDDGSSQDVLQILVLDANGNPVPSDTVIINPQGLTTTTQAITTASGIAFYLSGNNTTASTVLNVYAKLRIGGIVTTVASGITTFHYTQGPPQLTPPPGSRHGQ
jgi:hypothetical protein